MNNAAYPFSASEDATLFSFQITTNESITRKLIRISVTAIPDFYALALVDVMPDGSFSDLNRPRQQDVERVLATVLKAILAFTDKNPLATVFFTGSTPARTRLYQIAIQRELEIAKSVFMIQGLSMGVFSEFEPDNRYEGFAITRKNTKLDL